MKKELPNISILAILLILGLLLNTLSIYSDIVPSFFFDQVELAQYSLRSKLYLVGVLFLKFILNIFIAIWLFSKAKKQNENTLTWSILGLFFGLIALILFYLIILIKEVKLLNSNFKKDNN